jgi:hypothetical protein
MEMRLAIAIQMISNGAIEDGKTIVLLQYAAVNGHENLRLAGSIV